VPELTGFWLLTLIIEAPGSIALLVGYSLIRLPINEQETRIALFVPMLIALEFVHALFVVSQVFVGLFALRILAKYQVSRFHYKQYVDNKTSDELGSDLNTTQLEDVQDDSGDDDAFTKLEKSDTLQMRILNKSKLN
jgi:hypothetical protein